MRESTSSSTSSSALTQTIDSQRDLGARFYGNGSGSLRIVSTEDLVRLAAIIDDRIRPLKHIQRAQIILFSADRLPVLQVARRAGASRPAVWRWQKRYAEASGRAAAPQNPAARQDAGGMPLSRPC
jgi:hypothetical protein